MMDGFLNSDGLANSVKRDQLSNPDIEIYFVGTVIMNPNVFSRVQWLSPDDFTSDAMRITWDVMKGMYSENPLTSFDPMLIAPRLAARGFSKEDSEHVARESAKAAMSELNAVTYAEHIKDLSYRRAFFDLTTEALEHIDDMETPGQQIFSKLSSDIQKLAANEGRKIKTKREVADSISKNLDKQRPCYWTGLNALDNAMGGGMYGGRMYGFAARKKVGKTVLLGSISDNLNAQKIPHLFVAMETPADEIEQRNIAQKGGFNSIHFLRRDNPTLDKRVREIAEKTSDYARFYDAPGATFDEIKSEIMREIIANGIKGVVLDYWQLVQGRASRDTEELHLRNVAQGLADICRREGVFVAIAAQVNQDGNTRGGEGLKLACDQYYTLHREKDSQHSWLEMEESRYTIYQNVGSENVPGLIMSKHGPAFVDAGFKGTAE